ncbi:MAG TPA: helix-turn-helix domain-containing protein [Mycobacteriales bacterium]|nr:helix-turn-helix domain-containing protein [Mycobacteriales bacterium]
MAGLTDEQKRQHAIATNVYRRKLSAEQRREMVARLRADGMSTRQIAEVAQVSHETVRKDLPVLPANDLTGHTTEPVAIKGQDGKTYPSRSKVTTSRTERETVEVGPGPSVPLVWPA